MLTIQDLENKYYGSESANLLNKADAPVLTSTTGVYNAVFGRLVWSLLNQEANVFGLLPKSVWNKSGWRNITAKAGTDATGGISEGGAVPDTIKPTFVEVTNTLKTVAHTFEVSEIQEFLVGKDDAASDLEYLRGQIGTRHKEMMNQMLLADASAQAAAATANYTGTTNIETIDRVISSDSEEDAFGGTYTSYFDIFGLDRDSATTYDAYVDHNSGTDRDVTDAIIRDGLNSVAENGGNTSVMVTGHDTYSDIVGLYSDQVRYQSVKQEGSFKMGVNGIQTEDGIGTGINIATIYGVPLLKSKDVTQDTTSRIYLLDTTDPEGAGEARISLSGGKPTQYFESGIDAEGPFATDKFTTTGLYRTLAEIKSPGITFQGKIRDLK